MVHPSAIEEIRDRLADAKRYLRWDRQYVEANAGLAVHNLQRLAEALPSETPVLERLRANLAAGIDLLNVSPSVLRGYLDGASQELAALKGRLEKP